MTNIRPLAVDEQSSVSSQGWLCVPWLNLKTSGDFQRQRCVGGIARSKLRDRDGAMVMEKSDNWL
jgi:hypothetical protein